jgi:hypothetical protein
MSALGSSMVCTEHGKTLSCRAIWAGSPCLSHIQTWFRWILGSLRRSPNAQPPRRSSAPPSPPHSAFGSACWPAMLRCLPSLGATGPATCGCLALSPWDSSLRAVTRSCWLIENRSNHCLRSFVERHPRDSLVAHRRQERRSDSRFPQSQS